MQKLKNRVLERMLNADLTRAEVDFLIELSHYQDEDGTVHGVYYKTICEAIDISYETFYVTMESLISKGLIALKRKFYGDRDLVLLDNDFRKGNEAYREGYINTGHDMFYSAVFKELKANEKLLAMQLLKIGGAGKHYHIGVDKFYDKYTKLLKVTKRTLQTYLGRLKEFFSIGIKDKEYWITPKKCVYKEQAPSDADMFSYNLGRVSCRRSKAKYNDYEFKSVIDLVKQYMEKLGQETASVIISAVQDSIEKQNKGKKTKAKWNRHLNPAFVHKLIKEHI